MVKIYEQTDPRRRFNDFKAIKRRGIEFKWSNEIIFERGEVFFVEIMDRNIIFRVLGKFRAERC